MQFSLELKGMQFLGTIQGENTKMPLKHKFWFWCGDFVFFLGEKM